MVNVCLMEGLECSNDKNDAKSKRDTCWKTSKAATRQQLCSHFFVMKKASTDEGIIAYHDGSSYSSAAVRTSDKGNSTIVAMSKVQTTVVGYEELPAVMRYAVLEYWYAAVCGMRM
jgi:hypothetical protein